MSIFIQRNVSLALLTRTWYSPSVPHQPILNPSINHLPLNPPPSNLSFIAFSSCRLWALVLFGSTRDL